MGSSAPLIQSPVRTWAAVGISAAGLASGVRLLCAPVVLTTAAGSLVVALSVSFSSTSTAPASPSTSVSVVMACLAVSGSAVAAGSMGLEGAPQATSHSIMITAVNKNQRFILFSFEGSAVCYQLLAG